MLVLGVDCGRYGALAFCDGDSMDIADMPLLTVRKNGKVRHEVDGYALARIIDDRGHIDVAAVELVGAMPSDGAIQAFAFGKAFGEVVGVLRANFIPLLFPAPRTWRKAMGVTPAVKGDKQPSIARATALLPQCSGLWAAVRGNGCAHTRGGRAEAALIALYCWLRARQQPAAIPPSEHLALNVGDDRDRAARDTAT